MSRGDTANYSPPDVAVSRAGFDARMSSSSSFLGTDQRHVTSVTSCRPPASLATVVSNAAQFAQPPNYDKNMNIQPIRAHCKYSDRSTQPSRPVCLFLWYTFCVLMYCLFFVLSLVISKLTSIIDCLERLVSEMIYFMSIGT